MKKNFLFLMLAAGMTLAFTACSSDDDDSKKVAPAPETKTLLWEKTAIDLDFTKVNDAPFEKIILTETGKAVLSPRQLNAMDTRATASDEYIYGTYVVKNNEYTIYDNKGEVYCVLIIESDPAKNETKVTIKEDGKEDVVVTTETDKKEDTSLASTLCRDWSIVYTDLKYKDAKNAVGKFFVDPKEAASLNAILDYAKTQATIEEELEEGMTITDVIFTRSGSFIILFANSKCFVGKWKWENEAKGGLTYDWDDEDMKTKFENGTAIFATGVYKKVTYYTLTLESDKLTNTKNDEDEKYEVTITLFLKEK